MGRKKKKSLATKAVVGALKGTGWLIGGAAKLAWKGAKAAASKASEKAQQPKAQASYESLEGASEDFEERLFNESLILAIAGRRGSGKSALGFRLLENIHAKAKRPCFALGVKQSALPSWIKSIEELQQVKNKGVVLVDEGAIAFGSRESMSKKNRVLGDLLAIARHKDLTLLFITQNTGMIDKNVLNLCDTIVLKEGSLLQEKMERSVIRDLYKKANEHISKIPSKDRKPYCYIFDADFEGLIKISLPSFWSTKVSKNQA